MGYALNVAMVWSRTRAWLAGCGVVVAAGCSFDDHRACGGPADCTDEVLTTCFRGFCVDPAFVPGRRPDAAEPADIAPDARALDAALIRDASPQDARPDRSLPPPRDMRVDPDQAPPPPPDMALPDAGPLPGDNLEDCPPGAICLLPVADAWIDREFDFRSNPDDPELVIRYEGPGQERRALMRFSFANWPRGLRLQRATLEVFVVAADQLDKEDPRPTLVITPVATNWPEEVTWASRPEALAGTVMVDGVFTPGTRIAPDVTELIAEMIEAGTEAVAFEMSMAPAEDESFLVVSSRESIEMGNVLPWLELRFE